MNNFVGLFLVHTDCILSSTDINIWVCSGPNKEWDAAVAQFSSNLRPAEANIAEKLKPRLHNTSTKQVRINNEN